MESTSLKASFNQIAKRIEGMLKAQAPSTKIARGIRVVYTNDAFVFLFDEKVKYGLYLWKGTKDERAPGALPGLNDMDLEKSYEAIFDRPYDPNPGKGVGGIKPRYWLNFTKTSLNDLQREIEASIEKAINDQIQKLVNA